VLDLFKAPRLYWYRLVLAVFQPFYIRYFRLEAVGLDNLPKKGPYLMVSNHSHLLDPFFIGALIRKPVFQMASNEFFRKPLVRRFMWAMGAFPRKKGFVDFKSIKYAIHIVKKLGFPLIIYPEGGRNWDGETLPVLKSTAKLVKLLNVPLVTIVSKGNYLAYPRWADRRRKSRITIHYSKPVMFGRKSSDAEIIDHIQKGIYNNDNFTKISKIRGKKPAEGLPRLIWRCPSCRMLESLIERNDTTILCTNCGKQWKVNLHCFMRECGENEWRAIKKYADRMFDAQEIVSLNNEELEKSIRDELAPVEKVYLRSKSVMLFHEPLYPKLEKVGDGVLYLTNSRLIFLMNGHEKIRSYGFEHIRGRSTERNTFFQIVLDEDIARFEMHNESCYKWEIIYDYVRVMGGYSTEE
jgi:1-acyl-sn-glycerol-3-phosphate acyltransferase